MSKFPGKTRGTLHNPRTWIWPFSGGFSLTTRDAISYLWDQAAADATYRTDLTTLPLGLTPEDTEYDPLLREDI